MIIFAKKQLKINIGQHLLFFSFIILAGMGFVGYAVYESNQKLLDSEYWVQHTGKLFPCRRNILSFCKDVEITHAIFLLQTTAHFFSLMWPR